MPTPINVQAKQLHDQLLAQKPEGVTHEVCAHCTTPMNPEGGTSQVQTYTAEDVQAAVDAAIAELQSQVAALESAAVESETEAKIAAMQADADAAVQELQDKLDEAVLKEQAAIEELASFRTQLEEIAATEALQAEVASRRDERLARVKESASFPEEYLEANADRFAAMSDDDFEARLAEWASLAPKTAGDSIPKTTALSSTRETAGDNSMSAVRDLMHGTLVGVDPRTL